MLSKFINALSLFSIVFMITSLVLISSGDNFIGFVDNFKKTASVLLGVKKSTQDNVVEIYKFNLDTGADADNLYDSEPSSSTSTPTTSTEELDITDWRIFYKQVLTDNIRSISLKYPPEFTANETKKGVVFSYEYDGNIYTFVLGNEQVNFNIKHDDIVSTTTKLGNFKYEQTSYIKNGTTTAVFFEPISDDLPFAIAFGTLSAKSSDKYEKVFKTILTTIYTEPTIKPFVIKNLNVVLDKVILKTKNNFGGIFSYNFSIIPVTDKIRTILINVNIEDSEGNILYNLPDITSLKTRNVSVKLPPYCENNIVESKCIKPDLDKHYYVVMRGFSCRENVAPFDCPEYLRDYSDEVKSNPFKFIIPVEFKEPSIHLKKIHKDLYEIYAQVYGYSFGFGYIVLFDDGDYEILSSAADNLYKGGPWRKDLSNVKKILILRLPIEVIQNNIYNSSTYDDILSYGQVIYTYELK